MPAISSEEQLFSKSMSSLQNVKSIRSKVEHNQISNSDLKDDVLSKSIGLNRTGVSFMNKKPSRGSDTQTLFPIETA